MQDRPFKAMIVEEKEEKTFTRRIGEKTVEALPPGDVLIEVAYSSLNYKDALSCIGNRGVTRQYPHTPGIDAAGVVVHSDASDVRNGDEVLVTGYDLGMNTSGGFGRLIRVPAGWVVPLPEGLTLRESMIYGTAGFTAAQSVLKIIEHGVKPEDGNILVSGSTGGVGSVSVSLLAHLGYNVIAVTGKKEEYGILKKLGAFEIISRDEATDNSGRLLLREKWAAVIDTVGGPILEAS